MAGEIEFVVVDAAPLIALAAAHSLDYLPHPDLPVIIPDAVSREATAAAGKLGAQTIIGWHRAHTSVVRVEPAETFRNAVIVQAAYAAAEVLPASYPIVGSIVVRDASSLRPVG